MVDYIIVGSGLAGISFAEIALRQHKSIMVFNDDSQQSSKVAGGLYNPVILKRFTEVWQAQGQLAVMQDFYEGIRSKIPSTVNFEIPILRKFFSVEEQNNWFTAADKPNLAPFLSTNLVYKRFQGIDAPFGYGEVLQTGYVDTALLVSEYQNFLFTNKLLQNKSFDYSEVQCKEDFVLYAGLECRHLVFAEGFGLHANPFFNDLPLDGTKGELFIIKAPELKLDVIVNTSVFILPLGHDLYKVGATHNKEDKTNLPTAEGKMELVEKIKEIINCDFEIIKHYAGVRPTVRDRRPLVGTHGDWKRIHILNGLGTRGVMLGPSMAKALFEHIENGHVLDKEIDIKRFKRRSSRGS